LRTYIWMRGGQSFVSIDKHTLLWDKVFCFKFGFASAKPTFEETGCEVVVAALVPIALPSGKDRKSLVTSLLQQGSPSLRLVAVAHCCNCFLRFDLELADVDIASFSFNSSIRATAGARSSSRLYSFCLNRNAIISCFLAEDDAEDLFDAMLHMSLAEPSLSAHSCTNCSYFLFTYKFSTLQVSKLCFGFFPFSLVNFGAWHLGNITFTKFQALRKNLV